MTFLWFLLFSLCHSLHVTINKTNWCFVHLYLLFYYNNKVLCWWSIINHLLSIAMKTLNLKYFGVMILIFKGHVTSSECDHRTRREHFPIGGQWWPCAYLARVRRYRASKQRFRGFVVTSLTFWRQVTSSVTWSFNSGYVVFYWWSIGTMRLSCTNKKI